MSDHIKQIKLLDNTTYDVGVDITAAASDDDIVVLTGTNGTNAVTYDVKHAKKGPNKTASTTKGATTDVTVTAGASTKTIKVPKVTVDNYGHTTDLTEQTLSITIPATPTNASNNNYGLVKGGGNVSISNGTITVNSVETVGDNSTTMKFFSGTESEYGNLPPEDKQNTLAVITDEVTEWKTYSSELLPVGTYQFLVFYENGRSSGERIYTSFIGYCDRLHKMTYSLNSGDRYTSSNTFHITDSVFRLCIWPSGQVAIHTAPSDGSSGWSNVNTGYEIKYRRIYD